MRTELYQLISVKPVNQVLVPALARTSGCIASIKMERHDADQNDAGDRHRESGPYAGLE